MRWTDLSKISIYGSDGRKYVRRCIEEEVDPNGIRAIIKNPTSECISVNVAGRLHVIVTMNSEKYSDTILQAELLISIKDIFPANVPHFGRMFSFLLHCSHMHTVAHEK